MKWLFRWHAHLFDHRPGGASFVSHCQQSRVDICRFCDAWRLNDYDPVHQVHRPGPWRFW